MFKQRKTIRILIILTIALIWAQSILPPDISADESGFVLEKIVKPFLRFMTGREAEISEHLVRKIAHFTEFMLLGLLVSLYRIPSFTSSSKAHGLRATACFFGTSALFCLFIAFIDESIQMFTGRGPAILDVWIDTAGAVTGIGIELMIDDVKRRM